MKNKCKRLSKGKYMYGKYKLVYFGYYPPERCCMWEAVNIETGNADFHAKTKKQLIEFIDCYYSK